MDFMESYNQWCQSATDDKDLIAELESIKDNKDEIYERFYRSLEFGTAGLRGVIGAGTNRMNIYVVRHATQGLANYVNSKFGGGAVAISHDSRIKADLFMIEAAKVLAANGIKAYITSELQPTPVLSFLVRDLKCQAGIMVTASHNPAKYNGYKAYGEDGCQMTDVAAGIVYDEICKLDIFKDVKTMDFDEAISKGLIEYVADEVYDRYIGNVKKQQINEGICKGADLKVVYTPLNGTGNKLVRRVLGEIGVEDIKIVKEQEMPDGNFTTCPYPNPEIKEALQKGLELCEVEKPDLLLATDPDADRVGIAVIDSDGSYRLLTGNETGIMLTDYILSNRKRLGTLPEKPIIVKTIVTSIMIDRLCEKYGCELKNVLTGFKYIGEVILNLEPANETDRFVFGFEESYGYLAGSYVRDKDAVVASMLICEMAAYYKKQGKTLAQVIDAMYEEYGYYKNTTLSFSFDGAAGMQKMADIMASLRANSPAEVSGMKVVKFSDFKESVEKDIVAETEKVIELPKSNVLAYYLEGNNAAIVRPSGTEPKIKIYVTAVGKDKADAQRITDLITDDMKKIMGL
ncbi:phosphoglucomutase [Anaeromassilibacillus sp. An172]|uniref:phospho-sugar mutase n=1 Tax=Anaeromassilibacillus sp. An172 TaxID=1965570 RepID=UPI000B3AC471|nr:phospho-sugar mutase [Anaeromassilibacillus sp. An172]OUP79953.1 phosphoglucomutase [Anaeromassilibacillus sp. An172]